MGDNEKEFDIGKIRGSIGERVKTLLSPDRCEGLTNVDIYNKIYGNTGTGEPSKKNKISALRRGEVSTDMEELIRIAHAMDVSLDWLMLGKGDPPPELQGERETADDNLEPGNTVRGFLSSLMCLSLAQYVFDLNFKMKTTNYFQHEFNISFSIKSMADDESQDYWQCDTVSYLTEGLRNLAGYNLFCIHVDDDGLFKLKGNKYSEMLRSIPQQRYLLDYRGGIDRQTVEHFAYYGEYQDDKFKIPKNYQNY